MSIMTTGEITDTLYINSMNMSFDATIHLPFIDNDMHIEMIYNLIDSEEREEHISVSRLFSDTMLKNFIDCMHVDYDTLSIIYGDMVEEIDSSITLTNTHHTDHPGVHIDYVNELYNYIHEQIVDEIDNEELLLPVDEDIVKISDEYIEPIIDVNTEVLYRINYYYRHRVIEFDNPNVFTVNITFFRKD